MLARLSALYDRVVLDNPRWLLACLALIFTLFAYFAKDFKLDASADSLLLETDKDLRTFREVSQRYKTRDFLFVTFTPTADLFSGPSLAHLEALRDELAKLDRVDSVVSILDVPLVKIIGGKLSEVAKNYRTLEDHSVDKEKAKQELITSPLFRELIIGKRGRTTAVILNLKPDARYSALQREKNDLQYKRHTEGLTPEEQAELKVVLSEYDAAKTDLDRRNHANIERIREIIKKYDQYGALHLGGLPMITDDMITYVKRDLIVFGAGVALFLVVMLSTIFRRPRWVVLPLLSCLFAGTIMVGLLGLIDWRVTVISSNFISLMLIITMSMNVHLIVRYRQLHRDHADWDQRMLVGQTARRMWAPCVYTALTTMMGFGSLVVSDIKPVIDFGWMMTAGLVVTVLTSFLLFPAALACLKKEGEGLEREEVPFTAALASFTERRGRIVLAAALVLAVLSGIGISRLKVENSFINYFSDSTEIYQGLKLIDERLGGTTPLDIILKFHPDREYGKVHTAPDAASGDEDLDELFGSFEMDPTDAWFTSYKIDRIRAVHRYLESLPAVGKVLSLASILKLAEDLNRGEEFDAFELAIIYKRIPPELRTSLIDPYISIPNNEARITLRILDSLPDLRRKQLLDKINTDLHEKLGLAHDEYQITGLLVLYNNMLQSLFKSQILTLGVVMVGIALMLLVLFRSVSLAIIGIIPNILAACIILGLMGLVNIPLDMMTITIAAITIGIAVDNAIHYIYRFREEFPKTGDYIRTMKYCHANIGRAVFYTAITIIVGFSILVFSNFIPTIYFGLLTALAMFIALLAALTLLPKLILIWRPFRLHSEQKS